jgi:hypothetical protein
MEFRRQDTLVSLFLLMWMAIWLAACGGQGDDWQPNQRSGPKATADKADELERGPYYIGPEAIGNPRSEDVNGLIQFRGNTTNTWYGTGPIPRRPAQLWRFPNSPMCRESWVGGESKIWCGSGWTGQPTVWERPDGVTEAIVGTYDGGVHFVDVHTGERTRNDFMTNDIIKGSVSLDPDGYPLLYFGSRDNKLRVLALDRDQPTELWHLNANVVDGIWNNDWDGNPSIVNDVLFEGGENSWFFAVKLNRSYDPETGLVEVDPYRLAEVPGYTQELLAAVGHTNVSIENSVVLFDDRVYFANGGGRVVGLDITRLDEGLMPLVFEFWVGEDVDASIVVDEEGMLYVSIEQERFNTRSKEIGQLVKLNPYIEVSDPYGSTEPLLWALDIPPASAGDDGGIWASPALYKNYLYVATHPGQLLVVDRRSGDVVFEDNLGWHAWSSPAVVDGSLIVTTCTGEIRKYRLIEGGAELELTWSIQIDSNACIESTPAVFGGQIVVGARDGYIYCFDDPEIERDNCDFRQGVWENCTDMGLTGAQCFPHPDSGEDLVDLQECCENYYDEYSNMCSDFHDMCLTAEWQLDLACIINPLNCSLFADELLRSFLDPCCDSYPKEFSYCL